MINKINLGLGIILLLLLILLINNDQINQIYPENNSIITDRQPTFKWTGHANKLIIDDNNEFTSPVIKNVNGNSFRIDELNFTRYYWKLVGKQESPILEFTIESLVALRLKNQNNLINVSNIGNTNLDVEVQKNKFSAITGLVILEQNQSTKIEINDSTLFIAKQR